MNPETLTAARLRAIVHYDPETCRCAAECSKLGCRDVRGMSGTAVVPEPARENFVLQLCNEHMGQSYTWRSAVYTPMRRRCPICEPQLEAPSAVREPAPSYPAVPPSEEEKP